MGRLNLNDNLFIGTQELKAFQDNILQFKTILGYLTNTYGFVDLKDKSRFVEKENSCWKVTPTTGGAFSISTPSYAFAYPNNLIAWTNPSRIIQVPNSFVNKTFWVKIKFTEDNFEQGTLKVDSQGNISGTNTKFLDRLRGEPNFASVIELFAYNSSSNSWVSQGQWSVESVSTNTSCVISTINSSPDTTISYLYKVVGTFPLGTVVTTAMKFPLIYDSCEVELVEETTENQAPNESVMMISTTEFYIARVRYEQGVLTVLEDTKYYYEDTALFEAKYSKWWSLK